MNRHVFDGGVPDQRAEANYLLERWLDDPALPDLVRTFDGSLPIGTIRERLYALSSFSERWDFRKGKERTGVTAVEFDEATRRAVASAVEQLGLLIPESPSLGEYSHIVIPGGTLLACVLRTRLARDIIDAGTHATSVYLLGTRRQPSASERDVLAATGDDEAGSISDEYEMLCLLAARELHATFVGPELSSHHGLRRTFQNPHGLRVHVLSTDVETRRATTGDTYVHLQSDACLSHGDSLLICTTQIYVPFQFFDAIRLLALPYGVRVEVVGFPMPASASLHRTENYLQEVRSAILSARQLVEYLAQ
jgi:hypothetical protein